MQAIAYQLDNQAIHAVHAEQRELITPVPLTAESPGLACCLAVSGRGGTAHVGQAAEWICQMAGSESVWGLVDNDGSATAGLDPILACIAPVPAGVPEKPAFTVLTMPSDWPAPVQTRIRDAVESAGQRVLWTLDLSLASVVDWLRDHENFGGLIAVVRIEPLATAIDLVEVTQQIRLVGRALVPIGQQHFARALVDACGVTLRTGVSSEEAEGPTVRQSLYNVLAESIPSLSVGSQVKLSIELPSQRWNGLLSYEHAVGCTRHQSVQITRSVLSALKQVGRGWNELSTVLLAHSTWAMGLQQFLSEYVGTIDVLADHAPARGALYAAFARSLHLAEKPSPDAAAVLDLPLARIRQRTAAPLAHRSFGILHFEGQSFEVMKSPFVIGRRPTADLVIPSDRFPAVSGEHCRLEADEWSAILIDSSRNGTFVNGEPIDSNPLVPGDIITLGLSGPVIEFDRVSVGWRERRNAVRVVCGDRSWPVLRVTTLGRYADCNVTVDWGQYPGVSGLHCEIQHDLTSVRIFDRSRNGTYINGEPVRTSGILKPGDVIMLGPKGPQFTLVDDGAARRSGTLTA